jgi:ABC-2 type transport system ATP-binding protein
MRQRLALAAALLGDPEVLVLDEPANGLDPQGMRWLRDLLRARAAAGNAVLVSSHVLAEVAQTVDEVVIIHRGRLVAQAPVGELTSRGARVLVRTPQAPRLATALRRLGAAVVTRSDAALVVTGATANDVGELAAREGVVLHELTPQTAALEDTFLALTGGDGA